MLSIPSDPGWHITSHASGEAIPESHYSLQPLPRTPRGKNSLGPPQTHLKATARNTEQTGNGLHGAGLSRHCSPVTRKRFTADTKHSPLLPLTLSLWDTAPCLPRPARGQRQESHHAGKVHRSRAQDRPCRTALALPPPLWCCVFFTFLILTARLS